MNRKLDRWLDRHATRMLDGVHRPPRPNELREACRLLRDYVRLAEKAARADPTRFGRTTSERILDGLETERRQTEARQALDKVYGEEASAPPCHRHVAPPV